MNISRVLAASLGLAFVSVATAQDSVTRGSQGLSQGSEASLAASGFVVAGSVPLIQGSAQLVREASVAAGTAVRVVTESVGYSLYVGARLIAFIPNEIGRALIHQSRHGAPAPK